MQYRSIGKSELSASVIGLGALHFGVFCDEGQTASLVDQAFDLGINFIDTAPLYGNGQSEELLGKVLRGRRDKFIISTKVGLKQVRTAEGNFGVDVEKLSADYLRRSVEQSLSRLKTDCIDLLQLHAFDPSTSPQQVFQALEILRSAGKIRYYGCSNYSPTELEAALAAPNCDLVSAQIHYNLIERRAERELIPLCIQREISVICNRALARGLLSAKYKQNQPLPSESRAAVSARIRNLLAPDVLNLISQLESYAATLHYSPIELALAWLAGAAQVGIVLVGARSQAQLAACAAAADRTISPSERSAVDGIVKQCGMLPAVMESPPVFFER